MIAGIFDEFLGVPMHPLAVHAPVVLVPIGAIAAIVLACRSSWRRRLGWWVVAGVTALVAMLYVAKESGESLEATGNVLGDVDRHMELADTTFIMSLVWLAVTAAVIGRDWDVRRPSPSALSAGVVDGERDIVSVVLRVAWVAMSIVTMVWLVRTGHTGAESRWVN